MCKIGWHDDTPDSAAAPGYSCCWVFHVYPMSVLVSSGFSSLLPTPEAKVMGVLFMLNRCVYGVCSRHTKTYTVTTTVYIMQIQNNNCYTLKVLGSHRHKVMSHQNCLYWRISIFPFIYFPSFPKVISMHEQVETETCLCFFFCFFKYYTHYIFKCLWMKDSLTHSTKICALNKCLIMP